MKLWKFCEIFGQKKKLSHLLIIRLGTIKNRRDSAISAMVYLPVEELHVGMYKDQGNFSIVFI